VQAEKPKDDFVEVWRGIAIAVVVYFHFIQRTPTTSYGLQDGPLLPFYSGNVGVLVFFIISGYLISKSLHYSASLGAFYAKRLSRIWPLFLVANIFTFSVIHLTQAPILFAGDKPLLHDLPTWIDLIGSTLFLADFGIQWVDGVFWSILVELKFYALIGLLAALSPLRYAKIFAVIAFCASFVQMGMSFFDPVALQIPIKLFNGLLIAQYLPFFAIGVLLFKRDIGPLFSLNAFMVFANLLEDSVRFPGFDFKQTLIFIVMFAGVLALDAAVFRQYIFRTLGKYSYSLYLFHQINGIIIISLLAPAFGIEVGAFGAFACTMALSVVMSWLAEWRFREVTNDFFERLFAWLRLDQLAVTTRGKPDAPVQESGRPTPLATGAQQ